MKLYSQASCWNPLMIETSGKGKTIERIFIFNSDGEIIAQTRGWFTKGTYGSNSSHKEVVLNYDLPIKNKKSVVFNKEKVFTTKTTYEYTTNEPNVDLYIHNDIIKFELTKYEIRINRIEAIYTNYLDIEITRTIERLDIESTKIQTKIYNLHKEMDQNKYNNDKYLKLCNKFKRLYNQKKKALNVEKERAEEAKIFFSIV